MRSLLVSAEIWKGTEPAQMTNSSEKRLMDDIGTAMTPMSWEDSVEREWGGGYTLEHWRWYWVAHLDISTAKRLDDQTDSGENTPSCPTTR